MIQLRQLHKGKTDLGVSDRGNVIKLRWQPKDLYTRNGIGVFLFCDKGVDKVFQMCGRFRFELKQRSESGPCN